MGTRGLCGFRYQGKDYLSYNHFDSYPNALGVSLLEEVRSMDLDRLKKAVLKLVLVNDSTKPSFEQVMNISRKFWDLSVGDQTPESWYCLLRNAQGTLRPYYSGELTYMIDGSGFIADSLFCEWTYIVNLDTMKFEVWRGFQKVPQDGNRYGEKKSNDYYPCALVKQYPLNKLPKEAKFLKDVEEKDDE